MSLTIFSVWCALVGVEGLTNKIIRQGNDKLPTWRLRDPTPLTAHKKIPKLTSEFRDFSFKIGNWKLIN